MSKKVSDTLSAYKTLLPALGLAMEDQVRVWTYANTEAAEASIELGGKLHSKDQKIQRQAVRACVLAYQALGLVTAQKPANTLREELRNKSLNELKTKLAEYATFLMDVRKEHDLVFGWSFSHGKAGGCELACIRARLLAIKYLRGAVADAAEAVSMGQVSEPYRNYFGAHDAARATEVYKNLQRIYFAIKSQTLWLYYRGSGLGRRTDDISDWPWYIGEVTGFGPGDYIGSSITPKQRSGAPMRPSHHCMQTEQDLHVCLGKGLENLSDEKLACTLVHELSHYVCGTRDVKLPALLTLDAQKQQEIWDSHKGSPPMAYMKKGGGVLTRNQFLEARGKADKLPTDYKKTGVLPIDRRGVHDTYGSDFCLGLARYYPDKAVHNADNYGYYSGSFT